MNLHTLNHEKDAIAEHAQTLLHATAEITGEKISEARTRLANALESAKTTYSHTRDSVLREVRHADEIVHHNPYPVIGIAAGVGALIGVLMCHHK